MPATSAGMTSQTLRGLVLLRFEREYAAPFCPDSQKGPAIRIKVVGSKFIPRISNLAISQIYCPVIDELARLRVRGRKTDVRIRGKDTITDFHGESRQGLAHAALLEGRLRGLRGLTGGGAAVHQCGRLISQHFLGFVDLL